MNGPRALGNLSVLSISVYSDLREQHKQIAGVDTFERVSRNIRDAVTMRDRHGWKLAIGAKILVDRINYRRLPDIIRHYRALGADSVALREVQGANHGEASQERDIGLREHERQEVRRQASRQDADPALLFFARALTATHAAIPPTRHCYNATDGHFACVDAEGEVYLGNPEIGDRRYSIGNILTSTWHDTWRSARHLEVIKLMDTLQQAAQCRLSTCRHVRANIGAEHVLNLIKPARWTHSYSCPGTLSAISLSLWPGKRARMLAGCRLPRNRGGAWHARERHQAGDSRRSAWNHLLRRLLHWGCGWLTGVLAPTPPPEAVTTPTPRRLRSPAGF